MTSIDMVPCPNHRTIPAEILTEQRCNNEKHRDYKNYGGREITYDPRAEASRRSGIKYNTLISRLNRNSTEEELFAELLKPTSARYGLNRIMKSHTITEKSY
jgi:hypothetical protein